MRKIIFTLFCTTALLNFAKGQIVYNYENAASNEVFVLQSDQTPLEIVANPAKDAVNLSDSVLLFAKPAASWQYVEINLPAPVLATDITEIGMKVYTETACRIYAKYHTAFGTVVAEQWMVAYDMIPANQWVDQVMDMSGVSVPADSSISRVTFAVGVDADDAYNIYIDNIYLKGDPGEGNLISDDYESALTSIPFVSQSDGTPLTVVANPAADAVNGSENVEMFAKPAASWQYVETILPTPIALQDIESVSMKVYSETSCRIYAKFHNDTNAVVAERWMVAYDMIPASQWVDQEMVMSGVTPAIADGLISKVTFALGVDADDAYNVYIDDITIKALSVVAVTGVTLDESAIEVGIGSSQQLTATVAPENATDKSVTWESSDEGIATVSASGNVEGVAAGTATITVTTNDGGFTDECEVTVTPLGIETQISHANLEVYPNPVTDNVLNLNVSGIDGQYMVAIYNLSGNMVYNTSSVEKTITLSTSGFATGVYTIKVESDDVVLVQKVLVK
jgi:uncharacterized protein YjdB